MRRILSKEEVKAMWKRLGLKTKPIIEGTRD